MDLIDHLKVLSQKIARVKDSISTEEATKNALIMPFISLLGYDVFDPEEVAPEYTADIGTKKGEKVDYAIFKEGEPIMFFECKKCGSNLDVEQASQLYRYFATNTKIRLAALTNGIIYQFYSDLDEQNVMDKKPFLEINMLDIQEALIPELKKITKNNFNLDDIVSTASELRYLKEAKGILANEWQNPSEDFVKYMASHIYSGVKTQKVLSQFTDIIKRAMKEFINDEINNRIKAVMDKDANAVIDKNEIETKATESSENISVKSRINTTEEELEGFFIVKSMLKNVMDISRLSYKDSLNYFSVIIDDSARKTVCRLFLNTKTKYISVCDSNDAKDEKVAIDTIEDIYQFEERIINSAKTII
jgi:hypothetical protein